MTDQDIELLCNRVKRGAKLYFGRDHAGRDKVKLVHGPFGIFTERYQIDSESLARLKSKLRELDEAAA